MIAHKRVVILLLLLTGPPPLLAQNQEPDAEAATAASPLPPVRPLGRRGHLLWRVHHGTARQTYAATDATGQLILHSGGVETGRVPVRVQRYYPRQLRLQMTTGSLTRSLVFDGQSVAAEQGSAPTTTERDLVLMVVRNSLEWVFGHLDQGALLRPSFEAVAPEDFNRTGRPRGIPRAYDAFELALPSERTLIFMHRRSNRIEVIRRWVGGQDIRVDFTDWRASGPVQLPYRVTWSVNGERRGDLLISQMGLTLR